VLSNPVIKAGLISGSLSLTGDLLAQLLTNRNNNSTGTAASYDVARAARMGSFGLFFYGPYQHFWYRALDRAMPVRNLPNFLAKVSANQLCLAPIVIAGVFAWNLALQNKIEELPNKVRHHFVPTLLDGWKFWIPAASVNFVAVPLQHQVLYMSLCGVAWTGYLSYSSANATQLQAQAGGKGKGKKK
jgi:protein Mpv17